MNKERYHEENIEIPAASQARIDPNSKFIIGRYEIVIKNTPEAIWEYAYNPTTWTASNADEHLGLKFYNETDRPETGIAFYQKEKVAGVYSDLKGHILWAERPKTCIWFGIGKYKLFGFIPLALPVSGVLELKPTSDGTQMSHTLYGRYPDTFIGRIFFAINKSVSEKPGHITHAYKELLFFKEKLDRK